MEEIRRAKWIEASRRGKQMPVFGKDFLLNEVPEKAVIQICGLGQFTLFINGFEVNEGVYEPGWTNYRKRCLYSVYDVSGILQMGRNHLRVMVGNGMYHVDGDRYTKFKASFGNPRLIAALKILGKKTEESVQTDESWRVCYGPIVYSSVYGGEDYDARIKGWRSGIQEAEWEPVSIYEGESGELKEAKQPPVRICAEWKPIEEKIFGDGRVRYDFGRNFAGRIQIRVKGQSGQQVVIIPGELLKKDGTIEQKFTGEPHYNVYTLSGEGEEVWMPRFTYYGQRYAVIETEAEILEVMAKEQCAACPQTGTFRCSNDQYNKIHELILRAIRSNMQSVFTDCPHREKLGWLEEIHLIGPGIMADFDARMLYEKILNDMADSQTKEGMIPSICPEYTQFEFGFRDSPEWGSACVLVPWYLYQRYGDKTVLERHFSTAEKYVKYLVGKSRHGIVNYGLGDWLDVGHYELHPANTPIPITATAILYQDLCTMGQIAKVLGRIREQEKYETLARECAAAFNETFYYPLAGTYATGSQTANAMALFLELSTRENKERVLKNLLRDIEMREGHFTGGDIGHPYILRALAKYGENEIIAKNLMKTDFPSYGYQVACGATTLCEDWDGPNLKHPVMSQNHFMLGAAEEWFYMSLAGIQVDASNEQESIRIAPGFVEEVDWVDCSMLTPLGICHVKWKRENSDIRVEVDIEKEGTVRLCLGKAEEVIQVRGKVERLVRTE